MFSRKSDFMLTKPYGRDGKVFVVGKPHPQSRTEVVIFPDKVTHIKISEPWETKEKDKTVFRVVVFVYLDSNYDPDFDIFAPTPEEALEIAWHFAELIMKAKSGVEE